MHVRPGSVVLHLDVNRASDVDTATLSRVHGSNDDVSDFLFEARQALAHLARLVASLVEFALAVGFPEF